MTFATLEKMPAHKICLSKQQRFALWISLKILGKTTFAEYFCDTIIAKKKHSSWQPF